MLISDLQWLHNYDENNLSQSVLKRVLYGEVSLSGDAHHEEGLEGHEDVLEGVPHIGQKNDEQLVLQVQVESLDKHEGYYQDPNQESEEGL